MTQQAEALGTGARQPEFDAHNPRTSGSTNWTKLSSNLHTLATAHTRTDAHTQTHELFFQLCKM